MFDRLKKALLGGDSKLPAEGPSSQLSTGPMSEFSGLSAGGGSTVSGKVKGRSWRMEVGKPTRRYIEGEELRARCDLGLTEDVAAMVMNRPLKETLEKQAYSMITDTLQTTADPNLPEEMRWLAMYDEVGWDKLPEKFWKRYAILGDGRENAMAWLEGESKLIGLLSDWPSSGPSAQVPFVLVLLRGKCYLRMQFLSPGEATMQHAGKIFQSACEAALEAFPHRA